MASGDERRLHDAYRPHDVDYPHGIDRPNDGDDLNDAYRPGADHEDHRDDARRNGHVRPSDARLSGVHLNCVRPNDDRPRTGATCRDDGR